MPMSRGISQGIIETIVREEGVDAVIRRLQSRLPAVEPLPPRLPLETDLSEGARVRRLEVLAKLGMRFKHLTGDKAISDLYQYMNTIESCIGTAQVPVGVAGPLRINGIYAQGDFYVPLATTEGALVASYNRGAMIVSRSGGVRALCLSERVSRVPGFVFADLIEAGRFIMWVVQRFDELKELARGTTCHGQLEDVVVTMDGRHVYLSFEYTTGDAAGQNMVTIATEAICRAIVERCPVRPEHWFIESNLAGDKKATARSHLSVRGKKVVAEILIPRPIFTRMLHTTPEKMLEYWKMSFVGGVQSGSIGVQGHYANGLAALFIACGQDAASVAEAAVGITRVDVTEAGDSYVSVALPSLIVGTVGGGTGLPTQRECLEMIGCSGEGRARKFAEICGALLLAGEISIMGALAAGQFSQAHERYARRTRNETGR